MKQQKLVTVSVFSILFTSLLITYVHFLPKDKLNAERAILTGDQGSVQPHERAILTL